MFPDENDQIVIATLATISDMGEHPVSEDELWEEISVTSSGLTRVDIEKTVRSLFAVNMLVYAFDRKLRLVNYIKETKNIDLARTNEVNPYVWRSWQRKFYNQENLARIIISNEP